MAGSRRVRRRLVLAGAVLGALALSCLVTGLVLDAPIPEGRPGKEADALARTMREAVHIDAWERTRALRFRFADREDYLWDRDRGLVEVRWDDYLALVRTGSSRGIAFRGGSRVRGEEGRELVEKAYASWINAAFWLQPFRSFFDEGTRRETVPLEDGKKGLLITYTQGGVTPGDSYLWLPGAPGEPPRAFRLWVSVIPIGGLEATWDDWVELETGALVSRTHSLGPLTLALITSVTGATTLAELTDGPDPFARLVSR